MNSGLDERETQTLIARFGPTMWWECQFNLDEGGYAYWWQATSHVRRAEVVMIVQRADGRLLLHSKRHYPDCTYRLPTGGIDMRERVLDALMRELWEELGLTLAPVAMPGIIRYILYHGSLAIPYASYLFLLRVADDVVLIPQDESEAIADLCWIEPDDLPIIADRLRSVVRAWGDWGAFRAIAHDLVSKVVTYPAFQPANVD